MLINTRNCGNFLEVNTSNFVRVSFFVEFRICVNSVQIKLHTHVAVRLERQLRNPRERSKAFSQKVIKLNDTSCVYLLSRQKVIALRSELNKFEDVEAQFLKPSELNLKFCLPTVQHRCKC